MTGEVTTIWDNRICIHKWIATVRWDLRAALVKQLFTLCGVRIGWAFFLKWIGCSQRVIYWPGRPGCSYNTKSAFAKFSIRLIGSILQDFDHQPDRLILQDFQYRRWILKSAVFYRIELSIFCHADTSQLIRIMTVNLSSVKVDRPKQNKEIFIDCPLIGVESLLCSASWRKAKEYLMQEWARSISLHKTIVAIYNFMIRSLD